MLFISFLLPLSTSQDHTALYSFYFMLHILISNSIIALTSAFLLRSIFVLHIFLKPSVVCLYIYLPRSPPLSPSVSSFPPPHTSGHPISPSFYFFLILFNETEDPAACGGDPHSLVPVCSDCLPSEWLRREMSRIDESEWAQLL